MTETISRQPAGIPAGGQFAATAHAEPDLTLAAETELATLGDYEVSAKALAMAREVSTAIEHQPDWMRHMAAEAWAVQNGYQSEWCDDYRNADTLHADGLVLVTDWGTSVTLAGQGRRNFSVDLDGDGDTLDQGDDNGSISPVTFIYPLT
jgi:hypothetical protein